MRLLHNDEAVDEWYGAASPFRSHLIREPLMSNIPRASVLLEQRLEAIAARLAYLRSHNERISGNDPTIRHGFITERGLSAAQISRWKRSTQLTFRLSIAHSSHGSA